MTGGGQLLDSEPRRQSQDLPHTGVSRSEKHAASRAETIYGAGVAATHSSVAIEPGSWRTIG
jgi:hypothetical protein